MKRDVFGLKKLAVVAVVTVVLQKVFLENYLVWPGEINWKEF